MRTLYVAIQFVRLHQQDPGFSFGNYLSVGGFETSAFRYSLEVGNGDPGQPAAYDTFDYAEFAVSAAVLSRPLDFGSTITYQTESGPFSVSKWHFANVPDDFVVPDGLDAGIAVEPDDTDPDAMSAANGFWAIDGDHAFSGRFRLTSDRGIDGVLSVAPLAVAAPDVGGFLRDGIDQAFDRLMESVADELGVSALYQAITNAAVVQDALSALHQSAADNLLALLSDAGGSLAADDVTRIVDETLRSARDRVTDAAEDILPQGPLLTVFAETRYVFSESRMAGTVNPDTYLTLGIRSDPHYSGTVPVVQRGQAVIILDGDGGEDEPIIVDSGRAIVSAGSGDDRIESLGTGIAIIYGGDGNDTITTSEGHSHLFGGRGRDILRGGGGEETFFGGGGADKLNGGAGDDTVHGGRGADRLDGGAGDDTLRGGAGRDVLTGQEGADVFAFQGQAGRDRITDFGAGDSIDLSGRGLDFSDLRLRAMSDGQDVQIALSRTSSIVLEGVSFGAVTAAMFDFG